jgi:hypothetical protein
VVRVVKFVLVYMSVIALLYVYVRAHCLSLLELCLVKASLAITYYFRHQRHYYFSNPSYHVLLPTPMALLPATFVCVRLSAQVPLHARAMWSSSTTTSARKCNASWLITNLATRNAWMTKSQDKIVM